MPMLLPKQGTATLWPMRCWEGRSNVPYLLPRKADALTPFALTGSGAVPHCPRRAACTLARRDAAACAAARWHTAL